MENSETNNSLGLNTLTSTGTTKNRKRVGRGIGSGTGKTATFLIATLEKIDIESKFCQTLDQFTKRESEGFVFNFEC